MDIALSFGVTRYRIAVTIAAKWTGMANTNISVYTLMKLLGHESMATSQRYVISAASETKAAAAQNPLYGLASDPGAADRIGSH